MNLQKVKGSLYGCAIGDSRGVITEFSTIQQIRDAYQNTLDAYLPMDSFLKKNGVLGTVTDDFGSSYYVMKKLIETNGVLNAEIAIEIIKEWSEDATYFKFAGPTTKKKIQAVLQGGQQVENPFAIGNYVGETTNGAAMKVVPLGVYAQGNLDLAIRYAIDMSMPTHDNSLAVAGACAISASVAKAQQENVALQDILNAGIYGARIGKQYMEKLGKIAIGCDLEYKIKEAIRIGSACQSYQSLLQEIDSKVGTNMEVIESVAAVYGIIAGVNGDCMKGIKTAVNIGGDTDTMAAMIGGILGGYQGIQVLPEKDIQFILQQNPSIRIKEVIDEFSTMIERRYTL